MKGLQLKTSIGKDTTLHLPVWDSSTKEAMLMHMMVTLDAIKKRGHFKAYKEAQALYVGKKKRQSRQKLVYLCLKPAKVQEKQEVFEEGQGSQGCD
jgi:hypothetical protein